MNRQAQSAVLFLLGASLLHAGTTDLYLRYVKQGLRPLVLAAGAVLVAAAIATVWYEWGRARRHKGRDADEGHTHHEPRVAWLLVLPLLALILVDPLPLSVVDYAGHALLSLAHSGSIAPDWFLGLACGLGGLVGGYLGARLQPHLPETFLRLLLGTLASALGAVYAINALR
ncbi:hypothetical protein EAO75_10815 [Streptomyces sp. uw30]|uniref:TSUP family transporter n=1 Tax=Streptomyces sp. uw30 TaxID=1828179 RepID=UPI0011CEB3CB|nr:TSUP family transporter [Streptomyces sp. uw30]TXS50273.1 hypothetical protein EAO75_10815 [Streptomyces sp. uw30]